MGRLSENIRLLPQIYHSQRVLNHTLSPFLCLCICTIKNIPSDLTEKHQLTEHDEGGCPLLISRGVGCIFTGVAASIRHFQVRNPDGRVLQVVMEEHHSVFEGQVGETLSIQGVENGDIVSLTINGFPYPWHLERWAFEEKKDSILNVNKLTWS